MNIMWQGESVMILWRFIEHIECLILQHVTSTLLSFSFFFVHACCNNIWGGKINKIIQPKFQRHFYNTFYSVRNVWWATIKFPFLFHSHSQKQDERFTQNILCHPLHPYTYILNKYIEATAAGNGPETEQKPNLLEHRRK